MPSILGGGLSGLSAAFYLIKHLKTKQSINLYESTGRLGGWMKTESFLDKKFLFESGPRTIRPKGIRGKNALKLIDDIGLSDKVLPIPSNHVAAKNRMIYVDGKLCVLPSTLTGIFRTTPPFSKPLVFSFINYILSGRPHNRSDESIYSFAERRFGKEIAKYAVSSLICGTCAGDAQEISVKLFMKSLFTSEQIYGNPINAYIKRKTNTRSVTEESNIDKTLSTCNLVKQSTAEKWSVYSLDGGIEILPKTIGNYLQDKNVNINLNSKCNGLSIDNENQLRLSINGKEIVTDYLISSIPSYEIGHLLEEPHPTLAADLKSIPYVNVAVINLQYNNPDLIKQPGFGFLIPPCEKIPILGIIYDSCCFNMPGNTVLTVMMGGKWFEQYFNKDTTSDEYIDIATKYIGKILNISDKPQLSKVNVLKKCIPQYIIGHYERIERIRKYINVNKLPLALCGAPYDGVGVNDVIFSAKQVIDSYLATIKN